MIFVQTEKKTYKKTPELAEEHSRQWELEAQQALERECAGRV